MRMMTTIRILAAAGLAALATVPANAQNLFGTSLAGEELEKAIAEAETHPLGSLENPIRVNMPAGEYAYLARLRCEDGSKPSYERRGNVGLGIYQNIIDLYDVQCEGQEPVEVYMDMYHRRKEDRPVPGFTIK